MGISGLLPLLKSIHKPGHLKKYAGQTIGVDAYGWLHRGTAACAIELALDQPTTKLVDFAMHRVRMLVHFGITPYIVFDGDYLPSKAGTEKERGERRAESKRLGLQLLQAGKTSQAHLELQKAVDVTPEMARQLIEELKHHNIQYVVAPYEADSQLVYLERQGLIDGILSEDSDLLVFGAKCLITKLDKYGECVEINRNLFTTCREVSLAGWSDADFRRMAMLSGCDYLPGIGRMGLKTAYRMLRKHKTVDRVVKTAQFDGQFKVPAGYLDAFACAENTFLYQWVFCPVSKQLVHLTPLKTGVDAADMPYIGHHVPADLAFGVARGDLNPHTKKLITVRPKDRSFVKPLRPASMVTSIVQTPDSKQSKPIDSFFKPKRTPLAELDPNSFTPSPSQQAVLQQHRSASWSAVAAPPSQPSYNHSSSAPRTAPQPARRTKSEARGKRASAPNPSKRQRLCSDAFSETPNSKEVAAETSPFFGSSVADPSPSMRPTKKSEKAAASDFGLWSDDSVEEAMARLVDVEEAASQPKKKKIAIFHDGAHHDDTVDSQSTVCTKISTDTSQETASTLTLVTSQGSPTPQPDEGDSIFSAALSAQVKDLRSKFGFSNVPRSRKSGSPIEATQLTFSQTVKRRRQELEVIPDTPKKTHRRVQASKLPPKGNTAEDLEASAWAAMEAEVVVAVSDMDSPTKPVIQGSEDLIVPDSEAESDCSPRKPTPNFNFGRFAFHG
ncbi:exonuclease-like protein [Polyplosphaeria fusca]|uniref:Exonuclease-like protein n=1 Tax=Polyplosphaeria fusca TaxID=682080 RepID=A0A9P4V382_9PLEO|nr:exonuclease-like protein [Polyplosphaeria fusca]